ncbi:MAG: ADYC domain-containing protein [Kofleriaceae bacterium]
MLDVIPITEVNEFGIPNSSGVVVDGLWKNGLRYQPDVTGTTLVGTRSGLTISGTALVGSFFRLLTPSGPYRLHIRGVAKTVRYWLGPTTTIESYDLQYTRPGEFIDRPLCAYPPPRAAGDGNVWIEPTHSILFAGDRYDQNWKIIASTAAEAGDWFNIGCAGEEVTKVLLNRHATAGTYGPWATTKAQRQDLLRMYLGDLCGTGRSFTEPNTELRWGISNGWRSLTGYSTYEAVWAGGRAICLNTSRLQDTQPTIRSEIDEECVAAGVGVLPPCESLPGFPGAWAGLGNVISGNP